MQYDTILAGAYQVKKALDHSTYSVLCLGKHVDTGETARLRLWLTAHVSSKEEQKRIQAEIAAIQQIQHPHLLPIREVRATEQGVFLASTFFEADSLHTRLNQHVLKPLPLDEALEIIKAVGQALHALHEHGITHGNLTPLAILVTEQGQAYLSEFHLQSIQENIQGYQSALDENIPRCWYMAPEQFSGQLNAQTDQYALGCLAYALLTGRVPFAGSARATLLQKHQRDQPKSLVGLNSALSATVETAVLKALAKAPADRHSSIAAFLEALGLPVSSPLAAQDRPGPEMAAQPALLPQVEQHQALSGSLAEQETLKHPALDLAFGLGAQSTVRRSPSTTKRKLVVFASLLLLALLIVLGGGEWLLFSGAHTPAHQILGNATSPSTQLTPGTTNTAGGAQVGKTSTVTSITLNNLTPTARPAAPGSTPTTATNPAPTVTPAPTATPSSPAVKPVLDCIEQNDSAYTAHFGYVNSGGSTVTIPVGSTNSINPSYYNGQQPTSFNPGTHHRVVQLWFFRKSSVSWTLDGITVTADSNSPMC